MKIGIIGAGGVGGYYGGRLAQAGSEVGIVARGEHLAAIRERGLRVRSPDEDFTVPVPASEDPADIGACDAVLFCVKSYDTESAAAMLDPLLGPDTPVVSLQNGVDNEEKIAARVRAEHVLGGASFILSSVAEPGVVEKAGTLARVVFGELDGSRSERSERLLAEFREARIESEVTDDIRRVLWDKYAFLCALAGLTAATRLPIDELLAVTETRELFRQMVREAALVARAEGVDLGADVVDEKTAFAQTLEPGGFSSLHHDLVTGRRLELDALHGELVRRASRHNLSVPITTVVYALLRPWQLARMQATQTVSGTAPKPERP
jgi:2-dehydropantoate 2-reductase